MTVQLPEAAPGRVSVVGRLAGEGGGRSLMLYAHLDTVGVEGMEAPFSAEVREGRMYGRGAYDMKGGARRLPGGRAGAGGVGRAAARRPAGGGAWPTRRRRASGWPTCSTPMRADAAIVTEPTELRLCLAHKGFCWLEVETEGRAAHGSRFEEGIDANLRMGRFLARLEALERDLRASRAAPAGGALLAARRGAPRRHAARAPTPPTAGWRSSAAPSPGETEERVVGELREIARPPRGRGSYLPGAGYDPSSPASRSRSRPTPRSRSRCSAMRRSRPRARAGPGGDALLDGRRAPRRRRDRHGGDRSLRARAPTRPRSGWSWTRWRRWRRSWCGRGRSGSCEKKLSAIGNCEPAPEHLRSGAGLSLPADSR